MAPSPGFRSLEDSSDDDNFDRLADIRVQSGGDMQYFHWTGWLASKPNQRLACLTLTAMAKSAPRSWTSPYKSKACMGFNHEQKEAQETIFDVRFSMSTTTR